MLMKLSPQPLDPESERLANSQDRFALRWALFLIAVLLISVGMGTVITLSNKSHILEMSANK